MQLKISQAIKPSITLSISLSIYQDVITENIHICGKSVEYFLSSIHRSNLVLPLPPLPPPPLATCSFQGLGIMPLSLFFRGLGREGPL